jgi:hypothetical protein
MGKRQKNAKDYRGFRIFGIRIVRESKFHKLVAAQCYILGHEYVLNKLNDTFYAGFGTPNYATLMEFDRAMKEFTENV